MQELACKPTVDATDEAVRKQVARLNDNAGAKFIEYAFVAKTVHISNQLQSFIYFENFEPFSYKDSSSKKSSGKGGKGAGKKGSSSSASVSLLEKRKPGRPTARTTKPTMAPLKPVAPSTRSEGDDEGSATKTRGTVALAGGKSGAATAPGASSVGSRKRSRRSASATKSGSKTPIAEAFSVVERAMEAAEGAVESAGSVRGRNNRGGHKQVKNR